MIAEVLELITQILQVEQGFITIDTKIDDVEQWDSLAHVMIIGELEDKMGIKIALDDAIELKSVSELLEKAGIIE